MWATWTFAWIVMQLWPHQQMMSQQQTLSQQWLTRYSTDPEPAAVEAGPGLLGPGKYFSH